LLKAIKSRSGESYLDVQGNWVLDVAHARKFSTSADLVVYCEERGIKDFDIREIEAEPVPTAAARPHHPEAIHSNGNVPPG
jgi:hypothetical protein